MSEKMWINRAYKKYILTGVDNNITQKTDVNTDKHDRLFRFT